MIGAVIFRLLVGLAVVLLLILAYKTVKIYLLRRKYRHIPGPPTNGLFGFYMGNLDIAAKIMKEGKVFADLMLELSYQHGEVFKFQILDKMIVFTINREAVKNILVDRDFPKVEEIYYNVAYPYNQRYLGNGLITDTDKARSKDKRHQFNPSFHRHMLLNFMADLNSKIDELMERFRRLAENGTQVVLLDEISRLVLDVIGNMAFGLDIDSVSKSNNEFNKIVGESLRGFHRITFDPFIMYKPNEWGWIKNYRQTLRKVRDMGKDEIIKRVLAWQEEDAVSKDILSNLLKYYKNDIGNIDNMVDDFLTFFVAGQETTANTLSFCLMEIGRNPDVLIKLREELDANIGSKSFLEYEDIVRLSYTGCIFKETLRMWPPIPELARMCNKPFQIEGLDIPIGTILQISTYVSSRYDKHFENPETFEPERFSYKNKDKIKSATYFPFSMGSRNCIGQNFAQMLAKVFLAKFVHNFDFKLDPSQNLSWTQEATLRPYDGVRCFLYPRSS